MGVITIGVYDNTFNFQVTVTMNVTDNALNNVNAWILGVAPANTNVVGANATIFWAEYLWTMTQNTVYAWQAQQLASQAIMMPAANVVSITTGLGFANGL